MTIDNTITVTLCDDPVSFGEMLTGLDQLEALKAAWKARVESELSYLADDGYSVKVWYGSRTKVEAPVEAPVDLEHRVKMAIDDAWDDFCADGCGIADDDSDDDGPEFALERIALSDMGKPDLLAEVETLSPADRASAEAHRFTVIGEDGYQNSEGGVVLFVGAAGRAGVCMNGDSSWTDASDATDAVRRYLTGNMVE